MYIYNLYYYKNNMSKNIDGPKSAEAQNSCEIKHTLIDDIKNIWKTIKDWKEYTELLEKVDQKLEELWICWWLEELINKYTDFTSDTLHKGSKEYISNAILKMLWDNDARLDNHYDHLWYNIAHIKQEKNIGNIQNINDVLNILNKLNIDGVETWKTVTAKVNYTETRTFNGREVQTEYDIYEWQKVEKWVVIDYNPAYGSMGHGMATVKIKWEDGNIYHEVPSKVGKGFSKNIRGEVIDNNPKHDWTTIVKIKWEDGNIYHQAPWSIGKPIQFKLAEESKEEETQKEKL
jgi:hypothetical protein